MKVLAIETSCDETGVALVEGKKNNNGFEFTTLKSVLLSQAQLHAPYGGVYPNLAKREHEKNLPILFEQFADDQYDTIAVTQGPGLEPALWTGIEFAKKIAVQKSLPLMGINHMEGHLISSLVQEGRLENIKFPVLGLLISGGHTEFVLMRDWFEYEIIGQTLDDAVGEAFDKVARMLELPYPGGPEISKLADQHREKEKLSHKGPRISSLAPNPPRGKARPDHLLNNFSFSLPRPMLNSKNCDVSFSGLKTAALYALKGKNLNDEEKAGFAREFEDAVADVFVAKTRRALQGSAAMTFVIGGGVAANRYIREQLQKLLADEIPNVEMRLPELSITGDNAIMIAQAALLRFLNGKADALVGSPTETSGLRAVGNLSISSQK